MNCHNSQSECNHYFSDVDDGTLEQCFSYKNCVNCSNCGFTATKHNKYHIHYDNHSECDFSLTCLYCVEYRLNYELKYEQMKKKFGMTSK